MVDMAVRNDNNCALGKFCLTLDYAIGLALSERFNRRLRKYIGLQIRMDMNINRYA